MTHDATRGGAAPQAATRSGRALFPFVVALPLYLALVWRFDYLCDDAYIYFRYAVNLADGFGLRFNPGEAVPVEGYSSFLWHVWQAGFVLLGLDLAVWTRIVTLALGIFYFVYVIRFVERRFALGTAATTACALFLAALPPFAMYTTGGMPALTYSLALFAAFERLFGDPKRPRGLQAALCALLAINLRVEGAYFALYLVALGGVTCWFTQSRELRRAWVWVLAAVVAGIVFQLLFRHFYHEDLLGNTARTKGGFSISRLVRGLRYSSSYFLIFPSIVLALLAPLFGGARGQRAIRLQAWAMYAATLGFATLVGGDFLPMGRFFLTGIPFAVVLLASWLASDGRGTGRSPRVKLAVTGLCALGSLLVAFDVHVAPLALRERVTARSVYATEYAYWKFIRSEAEVWGVIGRALRAHTRPGESLVYPAIGIVGFTSDLHIYDQHCLVTPAEDVDFVYELEDGDAGHDRYVPAGSFLPLKPTYLGARLIPKDSVVERERTRGGPWRSIVEALYFPVDESVPGMGEVELELLRVTHWEWPLAPLVVHVDLARGLDLSDEVGSLRELRARELERADELARAEAKIREAVAEGAVFATGKLGVEWISRGEAHTLHYQAAVWYLPASGPAHPAPRGAVVRSIVLAGEPTLNGSPPGWSIVPPASLQQLVVEGGTMLVVCVRPPMLPQ